MEIEIGQLIRAIRRLWWLPVVLGLLLGALGFGAARFQDTTYTATTQMLVTSQISGDAVLADGSRAATYVNIARSGPVLDRVILELGLDLTREELSEMINVRTLSGTQIIEVSVTSEDPELAADIANSITRNFVATATDLSIGELQRNLNDLRGQADTLRDRVTVIDAQLDALDVEENADDSQVQAEIAQLNRDRLQLSQTLADLERSIRDLNTSLIAMSLPVVVTDFATAPERGTSVSRMLQALIGVFLGGLIGAAWICYVAFADRTLRDAGQIVSQPLLGVVTHADIEEDTSGKIALLSARLAGMKGTSPDQKVAVVSARESTHLSVVLSRLRDDALLNQREMTLANGVLENAGAMREASGANAAIVVATIEESKTDDLAALAEILSQIGTDSLGTIVITG